MLNIQKILVPVIFTDSSKHVMSQAAWLARRFHAEVTLLHVVTPFNYPAGMLEKGHEITVRDLETQVVQRAQKDLDQGARPELDGFAVTRLLLRGEPADEIVRTAAERNIDLIMMSTHGYGTFYRLLLGSVTAKVLHESQCPVWTGTHLEVAPTQAFSIRHVLCSVDLSPRSMHTASIAAALAAACDATLTLAHITSGVEAFGPGGTYVDPNWKQLLVGSAAKEITRLQESIGSKAEVVIDSGNVPELLKRTAEKTKADLLIIGHAPMHGHLGENGDGYSIIRDSPVPVLSV